MKPDPIIDAIREVRHRISASVGHDAKRLVEHYRQLQARHPHRVLSRHTKRSKSKEENTI
uniref:Uncharacterized protein n=1 Tax=Candidatus Kentrum sp. TC TaxID=2126339 RepID=A0A450ZQQ7_9GAMM|nr:MAG: hypothetical protein BECKTC1821E_GA0114239_101836 [Candidatus Kentron sp. TC]VFK56107.1 MAG: hypothetical protein BECKTC1821F_GA0114240_100913 [Candidatus Kentron sp. TC]